MARTPGNFWKSNPFAPGGKAALLVGAVELGVTQYVKEFAQEVEDYAKTNAPWEDESGDARDGLNATAHAKGREWVIVLAHGVDYGIWLEVRYDGTYAIIWPTIEAMGPELMDGMSLSGLIGMGRHGS